MRREWTINRHGGERKLATTMAKAKGKKARRFWRENAEYGMCTIRFTTYGMITRDLGAGYATVSRHGIGRWGLIGRRSAGSSSGNIAILRVVKLVINKTLSPYQPGSRTILYDSLVPTDALHATRGGGGIGQCEWCADATSDGFVPNCLRLHRSPIGASDRLIMWSGHNFNIARWLPDSRWPPGARKIASRNSRDPDPDEARTADSVSGDIHIAHIGRADSIGTQSGRRIG